MPCPYFEPREVVAQPLGVRLPLIDEYDGVCRADPEPFAAPVSLRLTCCNHGNSARECGRFPADAVHSAQRFDVTGSSETSLDILLVEELHYAPAAWRRVQYSIASEVLEPEITDICTRAQLIAFCRSFLRHFKPTP